MGRFLKRNIGLGQRERVSQMPFLFGEAEAFVETLINNHWRRQNFSKMENLENFLKVEHLLLEFSMAENFKESLIILRFSQHFCNNAGKFLNILQFLHKCRDNLKNITVSLGFSVLKILMKGALLSRFTQDFPFSKVLLCLQ